MAKIDTYGLDSSIDPSDKVIGTDGAVGVDQGKTKNFTISTLTSYFSGQILDEPALTGLVSAASDAEAASLGVPLNGIYENSGQLYIRKV